MTADVERDIARTRGELALTLAALERKLAARYLAEEGLKMLKDNLGDDYGVKRGLEFVRNNPIPVAMIGLGAAWLIASQTEAVDRIARDERIQAARRRVGDLATDLGNRAGEMASSAAQRIGMTGNGMGNGADRPLGHTGNAMIDQSGSGMGSGWMHQVTDRAQDVVRSARDAGVNLAAVLGGNPAWVGFTGATGGSTATQELAETYYGAFIKLAEKGGMPAVCESEHFRDCIAARPANREASVVTFTIMASMITSRTSVNPDVPATVSTRRPWPWRAPRSATTARPASACGRGDRARGARARRRGRSGQAGCARGPSPRNSPAGSSPAR